MNAVTFLTSQPWIEPSVERLGWTLIHFLWQGVLIAAVYAAVRSRPRPSTRYGIACAALAAIMAAPIVTWALLSAAPRAPDAVAVSTALTSHLPLAASSAARTAPVSWIETGAQPAEFLPWVVAIWLAGTMVFWGRLMAGWVVAARWRSTQVRPAPPQWQRALNDLKTRIGISRPVRLLVSALVQTPAVVGWVKPIVLLPVGALAGLPPEQIEALLIHELAHIRRHDYLVNILQSVAEALLFYHPAVWWISGHIRAERELCCDDIAVSITGDAFTYALALADLESSRPEHLNTAMAASGGSLAHRIARLLGQSRPASRTFPGTGIIVSALLLVAAAYGVFAQSADSPRFDVASIKLNTASVHIGMGVVTNPGGRLTAEFAPVQLLIRKAYGVQSFQISGGPDWINTDGYDIEAKAEGNPSERQLLLMLQSLLEDRFKLRVHRETKELPVYALTVAKGGLKLQPPKEGSCVSAEPNAPEPSGPPPQRGSGQPLHLPCGGIVVFFNRPGPRMIGGQVSMANVVQSLTNILGRAVMDKTGFTGKFDVHLEFAFDDALAGLTGPNTPPFRRQEPGPGDLDSPSIFAAIQQQLGLKLESAKGPAEVLVVDHVERPTEN